MIANLKQCLQLGKDHPVYGKLDLCQLNSNITCAISVGADKDSPSLIFKGDKTSTNEDAVFAAMIDDRVVMAVADSHFGQWASHSIITGIAHYSRQVTDLASIYRIFPLMGDDSTDWNNHSETTLVIVSVNRLTGEGFGVSFGDSSAVLVNQQEVSRLNHKNSRFVSLNKTVIMDSASAEEFTFNVKTGELLLLFTDGVDECHYGKPDTSVNEQDILNLFQQTPENVTQYVTRLGNLALKGINGNPGGQDNIAIAAVAL